MCAILDNSVRDIVFGSNPTDAAKSFRKWVEDKKIPLVVGGHLKTELCGNHRFRDWLDEAARRGAAQMVDDDKVNEETTFLKENSLCESDDEHVIALAQVSGARLLYADDRKLEKDFRNKALIDTPRGKIYSKRIKNHRRWLDKNKNLCNKGQ